MAINLHHPDTGADHRVDTHHVADSYRRSGWVDAPKPSSSTKKAKLVERVVEAGIMPAAAAEARTKDDLAAELSS
jgi:hypothetical protein